MVRSSPGSSGRKGAGEPSLWFPPVFWFRFDRFSTGSEVAGEPSPWSLPLCFLFHRYTLGQVSGLVDVQALGDAHVIGHHSCREIMARLLAKWGSVLGT